jgi:hypothetical protein
MIECMWCDDQNLTATYICEMACTGYILGKEHLRSIRKSDPEHPVMKHFKTHHKQECSERGEHKANEGDTDMAEEVPIERQVRMRMATKYRTALE